MIAMFPISVAFGLPCAVPYDLAMLRRAGHTNPRRGTRFWRPREIRLIGRALHV